MDPITAQEHIKVTEGRSPSRPLDVAPSHSTNSSLSPPNASPRSSLPSSPSALSVSRPPEVSSAVPAARIPSLTTAASTRNPSPSPQGRTTPHPVLLNSLTPPDDESILCIAVEEDIVEESRKGRGHSREREQGGVKTGGKVYGGSQGGDIHVRSQLCCARLIRSERGGTP